MLNEVAYFTNYTAEWKGLKKIFAVKREVEKDGEKTEEISCYLSSKNASAEELMGYTRKHWEIEAMHHILDVTYNEDNCQLYQKILTDLAPYWSKCSAFLYIRFQRPNRAPNDNCDVAPMIK